MKSTRRLINAASMQSGLLYRLLPAENGINYNRKYPLPGRWFSVMFLCKVCLLFVYLATAFAAGTHQETAFFEGSAIYAHYSVSADGEKNKRFSMQLLMHPEYVLLQDMSQAGLRNMSGIRPKSVILRQKKEEFVFLTENFEALIMTRNEVRQMISMFETMRGDTGTESQSELIIESTTEKREIDGYLASKWIMRVEGGSGEWHVWVTDQIRPFWGLLSENWLIRSLFVSHHQISEWMEKEKMPLLIEYFQAGRLSETFQFEEIIQKEIAPGRFFIPDGYTPVTFQQMLLNQMRNR